MTSGKLEFSWDNGRKIVSKEQLVKYLEKTSCKKRSFFAKYNGKPISCPKNGTYNIHEAADFLGMPTSHIYHLVNKGELPSKRKGSYHIFNYRDLCAYLAMQEEKKKRYI